MVGLGAFLGLFYVLFSDGFASWFPYINGLIIGVLVALFIAWVELIFLAGRLRFLKFYKIFILRTLLYATVIPALAFVVFLLARMLRYNLSMRGVLYSEEFQNYLFQEDFGVVIVYALALTFIASFTYQMSRKMGQGMFWSFITGRFYRPVLDKKVFMFVKIRNSDRIIQKTGRLNFHGLLKDVTYHITPAVLAHKGVIHHYVEDEIVIYWNRDKGYREAHCLRLYYAIVHHFEEIREELYRKYMAAPVFHMAVHAGEVVQAEVGEVKSEIAFYGDVMNTTSRMLMQCQTLGKPVLVSEIVRSKTELPAIYQWVDCGLLTLRGKTEQTHLYSIQEVTLPTS